MRKINIKQNPFIIKFNLIIILFLISCNYLRDDKIYLFPTEMKTITKNEIHFICNEKFYVKYININDKNLKEIKIDTITFKNNGDIYSSNEKIGYWKKDRNIYLSNYDLKFYFNSISKNNLRIYTRYKTNNDTILKSIRIILENKHKKEPFNLEF